MNLNYRKDCTEELTVRYSRNESDERSEWRIGRILKCLEPDDEIKVNGCKCRFTNGSIGFAREIFSTKMTTSRKS